MTGQSRIDTEIVTLWIARETGVLDALLSTAADPEEVASQTDLSPREAHIVTRALVDRGFFERVEGTYEPTNRALGFLTRTDPRSIGSTPHRVDLLERYLALPGRLSGDHSASDPPTEPPEGWTPNRLGAVAATPESTVRAVVTAAVREAPAATRILDVGGAPGTFAKEFVRRGRAVTLCDDPEAIARTEPFLANEPIDCVERSLPPGSLPGADLAFVPDLTYRLGADGNRRLLDALASALAPDGTVVLVDRLRGEGATDAALEALATTPGGDAHPEDRYREWVGDAGFEPAVREVPGTDRQAVVGRP